MLREIGFVVCCLVAAHIAWRWRRRRSAAGSGSRLVPVRGEASQPAAKQAKRGRAASGSGGPPAEAKAKAKGPPPPQRSKADKRLEWWQRLNNIKPALTLPGLQEVGAGSGFEETPKVYAAVAALVDDRLRRGKDWLVRDSDYGEAPAHSAIKVKVNAALVQTIAEVFGETLPSHLAEDPRRVVLLLDAPQYCTLREIVAAYPSLRCSQQVVVPQADLGHYFTMVKSSEFYPGVRAQRLDHWLCANAGLGLRCVAAFLDYECRLAGALSARLCPAADVMRYFRFGYPAEPASVLALTVGLEEPAPLPEDVDAFVREEARRNGYIAELRETWKYRMVTLLYVVRRAAPADGGATLSVLAEGEGV